MDLFHPTAALRDSMDPSIMNLTGNQFYKSPPILTHRLLNSIKPHEEHDPIEQIPVTPITGNDALLLTCNAFKQFYTRTDISSKVTYRLPGIIVLPATHAQELSNLVERVNEEKTIFQEQVQKLGDRDTKFEIVHQALPGLITCKCTASLL